MRLKTDTDNVFGLVCEKMTDRVLVTRQEEEDRRSRLKTVTNVVTSLRRRLEKRRTRKMMKVLQMRERSGR